MWIVFQYSTARNTRSDFEALEPPLAGFELLIGNALRIGDKARLVSDSLISKIISLTRHVASPIDDAGLHLREATRAIGDGC